GRGAGRAHRPADLRRALGRPARHRRPARRVPLPARLEHQDAVRARLGRRRPDPRDRRRGRGHRDRPHAAVRARDERGAHHRRARRVPRHDGRPGVHGRARRHARGPRPRTDARGRVAPRGRHGRRAPPHVRSPHRAHDRVARRGVLRGARAGAPGVVSAPTTRPLGTPEDAPVPEDARVPDDAPRPGGRPTRAVPAVGQQRRRAARWLMVGLGVALAVLTVLSGMTGQVPGSPAAGPGALAHHLGLDWGPMPSHPQGENALWVVRFPRVVMAIVVGGALACSGALMQGVFGNPLAEPGVIGVSSGAAVGACAVIVTAGALVPGTWVAAAAFLGGLVTTFAVYALARAGGRTEVVTLVLTGIAVNAFAGGLLAFFTFVADPAAREQVVFW